MKRTLGDTQARPDYLIAGSSLAFGLFCLGGWYSTHKKLNDQKKATPSISKTKVAPPIAPSKTHIAVKEDFTIAEIRQLVLRNQTEPGNKKVCKYRNIRTGKVLNVGYTGAEPTLNEILMLIAAESRESKGQNSDK